VPITFDIPEPTIDAINAAMGQLPLIHQQSEVKRAMSKAAQGVVERYQELLPRSIRREVIGLHTGEMPGKQVKQYEIAVVGVVGIRRLQKRMRYLKTMERRKEVLAEQGDLLKSRQRRRAGGGDTLPSNIEWLLEDGHRLVKGGTTTGVRASGPQVPGITAAGKRALGAAGYKQLHPHYWMTPQGDVTRIGVGSKGGVQLRGGGRVIGHVPGGHYLQKAVDQSMPTIEAEILQSLTRAIERLFV
jgi:hypothetical protein